MARVLVTGGAGFTGRYLSEALIKSGHEVHVLVHAAVEPSSRGLCTMHVADLLDQQAVKAVVKAVCPELAVHLAAISFVAHGDVGEMYRTNIVGTKNFLDALSDSDVGPKSVLVASSANIYGNSRGGVLNELTPPCPVNDYGVSKVAMELVAHLYQAKIPLTIVRPFNYTGVGQPENFLIPKIIAHARKREPVIELGNLDVARDFSDVRSVVETYTTILDKPELVGGTFNVCSGRAVTLREILLEVEALTNHKMEVRINPAFVRANEVRSLSGSAFSLESVIGPLPHISLRDTLSWMLRA